MIPRQQDNSYAVIGKELGSIHNSTLQFRFFGIDFLNAPIPTPQVELGGQLQLKFHGIGWIPRDSACLNFPLSIQVSLEVQKKNTSDTWFTSFFQFFQLISRETLESSPLC